MKKLKISFEEGNEKEKTKRKYKKYPRIDVNTMFFGDDKEIEAANVSYIRKIKSKVLKKVLLPTIIISVLLIAILSCAFIHICTKQQTTIEQLSLTNSGMQKRIDNQKERIEQLETANTGNITTEQVIQALQDDSSNASNNSNSTVIPNERKCSFLDCNSNANTGSYYCSRHECSKSGCHEPRANDLCMYCEKHKCDMPGCNSGKALNSYYCYMHS